MYVNTNAIADALGVTPATVAAWARDGFFPGARILRNKWAIPTDQAEAFVGQRLDEEDEMLPDEDEGFDDEEEEDDDLYDDE